MCIMHFVFFLHLNNVHVQKSIFFKFAFSIFDKYIYVIAIYLFSLTCLGTMFLLVTFVSLRPSDPETAFFVQLNSCKNSVILSLLYWTDPLLCKPTSSSKTSKDSSQTFRLFAFVVNDSCSLSQVGLHPSRASSHKMMYNCIKISSLLREFLILLCSNELTSPRKVVNQSLSVFLQSVACRNHTAMYL